MVNKAELRQFIIQYFSDLELDELCFDYYPDLLNQFTVGMTKSQKVIALISYCERRGLSDHLLVTLGKLRPAAYKDQFGLVPKRKPAEQAAGRDPNRIFLSHANQDAAFARQLADDLRHNGFDVWMAPDSIQPGEKWVDAIERGLETSGNFVLVITPHAVASKWVRDESNYAIALQNKDEMRIFTLHVGEGRMPPLWSVRQHISFREEYDEGLRHLLAALRPDRYTARPAPPPAEAAPASFQPEPLPEAAVPAPKPAARKPRAATKKKATPEPPPATEPARESSASAAEVAATTIVTQPPQQASAATPLPLQADPPAISSVEQTSAAAPSISPVTEPPIATQSRSVPIAAPDMTPEPAAARPQGSKPLYWAVGIVALLVVMFIGWRLMALGGNDIEPTAVVENGVRGSGAEPTGTPTRTPTAVVEETTSSTDSTLTSIETPTTLVADSTEGAVSNVDPTNSPTRTPTSAPSPTPEATISPTPQFEAGDIRVVTRGGIEVEQVFVPAGSFMMGSEDGDDAERPVHEVTLDAFWIDRTEVTDAQFAGCVADGACQPPSPSSSYTRDSYFGNDEFVDYPVIYVSSHDASDFCEWAGGRLPTEAEWEYAARGPEGFTYPWGNTQPSDGLLNFSDNVGDTSEVGSYPDGESWVGALDMAGNVAEWVNDWYENYGSAPNDNPSGPPSGKVRVFRGGSWAVVDFSTRSTVRYYDQPGKRSSIIGFRCAQE